MSLRQLTTGAILLVAFCTGLYFWGEWQKQKFDASLPKPPVVQQQTRAETDTAGHWHNGEWHADPHEVQVVAHAAEHKEARREQGTPSAKNAENVLSPYSGKGLRILNEFYKSIGVEPPPDGYEYRFEDEEELMRDESGNPILFEIGQPFIEIEYQTGFAPTLEQWERHLQLWGQLADARANGDTSLVRRLEDEFNELESASQGRLPIISAWGMYPVEMSEAEIEAINQRYVNEARKKAYQELGLGHLLPHIP